MRIFVVWLEAARQEASIGKAVAAVGGVRYFAWADNVCLAVRTATEFAIAIASVQAALTTHCMPLKADEVLMIRSEADRISGERVREAIVEQGL